MHIDVLKPEQKPTRDTLTLLRPRRFCDFIPDKVFITRDKPTPSIVSIKSHIPISFCGSSFRLAGRMRFVIKMYQGTASTSPLPHHHFHYCKAQNYPLSLLDIVDINIAVVLAFNAELDPFIVALVTKSISLVDLSAFR